MVLAACFFGLFECFLFCATTSASLNQFANTKASHDLLDFCGWDFALLDRNVIIMALWLQHEFMLLLGDFHPAVGCFCLGDMGFHGCSIESLSHWGKLTSVVPVPAYNCAGSLKRTRRVLLHERGTKYLLAPRLVWLLATGDFS